jgi:hypothetical protein
VTIVESYSVTQALLLHQSTTAGITGRVLLLPELRRAGESKVVPRQLTWSANFIV